MIDKILEARILVVAIFVCILAFAGYGLGYLSIDPNNRVFYSEKHEHYSNLIELEERFGSNTNLLFLIVAKTSLADDATIPDAIRWLSDAIWRIDRVVAVDSISSYPHVSGDQDELLVETMLEFLCPSGGACLEERLPELSKPHIQNRLVGRYGESFAVVADVNLHDPSSNEVTEIARQADQIKAEFNQAFPHLDLHLTGGVPMMQAFFDAAQQDSESLMAIAIVVLMVGLYLFLGGVLPTLIMLLLGVGSVVIAMGYAGWAGYVVNTATATVPLIVLTLVIASAMHIFLHIVREEGMKSRGGVRNAVRRSVAANWRPVLLTAGTTILGLSSMVFVSAPPIQEIGVLASLGVAAGAILSLTVVPCLFSYLPRLKVSNWLGHLQAGMNRYAKWLEARRPGMWWIALLFAIATTGLARASIDEDFVRYFSPDTSFRQDTEAITQRLASPYHIDVIYDSGQTAGIYQGSAVRDLESLVRFIREDGRVANAASIIDVFGEINAAMSGGGSLADRGPDELAQYFLSYELSLNIGQSTSDLVDSDRRRARVSILLGDVSMAELRDFARSIDSWATDRGLSDRITVAGEGMPTAYLSSESIAEMGAGIVSSIVFSAVLVGLYFRKLTACVGIFVAMVLPLLVGFGIWSWIEPEMGMAATLVVAITIGVIIDDTIHLTYRYVDSARNLDLTPWGATAYCIHKTGTAIVVTSVVLIAGLLVLMDSQFRMNATFGVCSSIVIAVALVYNLTLAPHFLRRLDISPGAVRGNQPESSGVEPSPGGIEAS